MKVVIYAAGQRARGQLIKLEAFAAKAIPFLIPKLHGPFFTAPIRTLVP
jgi:hypothetical protein